MVRKATLADAEAIYKLKEKLPIKIDGEKSSKGGFLLGTTIKQYETYITHANCMVAEVYGNIVGFGIIIPDEMLRATEIWDKRSRVEWKVDLNYYESRRLCYFEQLAFLCGNRRLLLKLAYSIIKNSFDRGADALFTTTVKLPVTNLAAIPLINVVHGTHAGVIDEYYDSVGDIVSDVYIIDRLTFETLIKGHPLYSFLDNKG